MADWNDCPIRETSDSNPTAFPVAALDGPIPEPLWRARPPLKSTGMDRALRRRMLPKIGFALRTMMSSNFPTSADHDAPFEVQHFTSLTLGSDESAAFAYVETLIAAGTSTDLIFLNLLAPSARRLGEMWAADTADFAQVTLGVSRLHRILRHVGEAFTETAGGAGGNAVLLTTMFGEQHSFGLAMAAEFFRRDGWDICTGPFASHRELFALVRERWFDVVGVSISSSRRVDELKQDIQEIRRDSRNPQVGIMVGGPLVIERPELTRSLGADLTTADGSVAPQLARELIVAMKEQP